MTQLVERNWQTLAACRSADPDLLFPLSSSGKSLGQVPEATRKRTPVLIGSTRLAALPAASPYNPALHQPLAVAVCTNKPTRSAGLRAFSLTSALFNAMLVWWRSEQRILLQPGDLDGSRFYRGTLGLAVTPVEAQDSAWSRSMAAYAVAAGWDGLGAGDAVRPEVAAGRLERGALLAGDEGSADPGHPQRPAVGGL